LRRICVAKSAVKLEARRRVAARGGGIVVARKEQPVAVYDPPPPPPPPPPTPSARRRTRGIRRRTVRDSCHKRERRAGAARKSARFDRWEGDRLEKVKVARCLMPGANRGNQVCRFGRRSVSCRRRRKRCGLMIGPPARPAEIVDQLCRPGHAEIVSETIVGSQLRSAEIETSP